MDESLTRRAIVKSGLAGAVLAPLGIRLAAAAGSGLASIRLTDRVSRITGAGANVLVLETDDGLIVVDSGAPEHADALVGFIDDEFGGAPVRGLFNTHWHLPHTGANEPIGQAGVPIYAHENTRLWMSTEYYVEWEKRNYAPRPAAALPTKTFRSHEPQPLELDLGGQRIFYGHLPEAHTDGDIYVLFPEENVIAVGGVLGAGAWPVLDYSTGGWIGGMQSSMQILLRLTDSQTQVVAAGGPPQTRADIEAEAQMLDTMRERIRTRIIEGKSAAEIVAENVNEGYEALGDPTRFVTNVYNGLWWGGRLRGAY